MSQPQMRILSSLMCWQKRMIVLAMQICKAMELSKPIPFPKITYNHASTCFVCLNREWTSSHSVLMVTCCNCDLHVVLECPTQKRPQVISYPPKLMRNFCPPLLGHILLRHQAATFAQKLAHHKEPGLESFVFSASSCMLEASEKAVLRGLVVPC